MARALTDTKPYELSLEEIEAAEAPARASTQTERKTASKGWDPLDEAWHLLTSVRLAFILILSLAALSLVGAVVIQAPAPATADPQAYADWLERIRPRFGRFTDVMSMLGLFDLFRSVYFRALLALLGLNIVVCSLNRWPAIKINLMSPRVRVGPGFFRAVPLRAELHSESDPDAAGQAVVSAFRKRGYRVLTQNAAGAWHIYADANRFALLGTYALHVGMVLILGVAMWSSAAAYRESSFAIAEGSTRGVGGGSGLAVKVEGFADEYYPDGPPKDYRSDLVLYRGVDEVARQTIRVNEPLEYQGWRFHQSFFGPAVQIAVRDEQGRALFSDGVPLAWQARGERPLGSFRIPERNLTVWLVGPTSSGFDPAISAGELRLEVYRGTEGRPMIMENLAIGRPLSGEGLTFTFEREKQFTGLQVVHDPTEPLMYVAWTLVSVGLFVVYGLPYRRFWARCQAGPGGNVHVSVGTLGRKDIGLSREMTALADTISLRLEELRGRKTHV